MAELVDIPRRRTKGGQSEQAQRDHLDELRRFADQLIAIQRGLDFHMGARGWCYFLEPHGLNKSDFAFGQECINEARREGFLRPGFILEDVAHEVSSYGFLEQTAEGFVEQEWERLVGAKQSYLDSSSYFDGLDFWADRKCFIQLVVEKADLVSLFERICKRYRIPVACSKGWGSIEQRAVFAENFAHHEQEGRRPVLFAVGDHDPPGLCITDAYTQRFREIEKFTGWQSTALTVERVGLNHDFITANKLSWIDNLLTGSGEDMASPRHHCYRRNTYGVREYVAKFGARKVEANAIVVVPALGRQMLQDAIDKYLGKNALSRFERRLAAERERIDAMLIERLAGEEDDDGPAPR